MPKLPQVSGKEMVKVLKKIGFGVISQKGSHIKMRKGTKTVIIPNHRRIKSGTLRNGILKTINLTPVELRKLLKK